jgi:hypothetical protein
MPSIRTTREEVAQHNTRNDCWVIISGKVYDITEWAPHHPGGAGIARMYAGKEATAEFGDYHSADAVAHMAHFCIGDLRLGELAVAARTSRTPLRVGGSQEMSAGSLLSLRCSEDPGHTGKSTKSHHFFSRGGPARRAEISASAIHRCKDKPRN